ncbi:MAG: class D sortase [Clostridia bacterium]|nr:class D sortase [Clostridia bacterium]
MGKFENKLNIEATLEKNCININENLLRNNEKILNKYENNFNNSLINEWKIIIPKINLEAEIQNGTTSSVLNKYVGHFDETPVDHGNIGLAAHNRGYDVNYFEKIKLLEKGDEIYYSYLGIEKVYIVYIKKIIKDTEWEWLENTKDNRITLITCVENQPNYRLCVQGIEK